MSKSKEKYIKLYFLKAPKGFGYHAGRVEDVPESQAGDFIKRGIARKGEPTLPEDLPGREIFLTNGIDDIKEVEALKDFTSVKGIGSKINDDLNAYFGRQASEPEEDEEALKEKASTKKANK